MNQLSSSVGDRTDACVSPRPPLQKEALLVGPPREATLYQLTSMGSTCHICGQTFLDRITLARHQVEAHTMEKTFSCTQCDKTFKELRTLRLHLKIHNSEYPEQCGVCKKVFRTKWQLKQHVMDHGGERPYPCPECTFTCKTKQQLNEHRRKHSGEKAYSCAQCNTRFTYRNGLIKHTKLNRCPKKILTAEGETIVKKRTRMIPKDPLTQDFKDSNNNHQYPSPSVEKTTLDTRILDAIQRRAVAKLQLQGEDNKPNAEAGCLSLGPAGEAGGCLTLTPAGEAGCLTLGQAGEAGCLSLGHAGEAGACLTIGQSGEPGCLSLGLLNSFTSSSSVSGQTPTILTTSADISSWAATLPAGTKVTVTHYDASKKHGQLELIATPTHTETIIVTQQKQDKTTTINNNNNILQQHLPVLATTTTTTTTCTQQLPVSAAQLPQLSAAKNIGNNNNKVMIGLSPFLHSTAAGPNNRQLLLQGAAVNNNSSSSSNQLLLPHNPHLYHSQEALNLFSSIGVPNYTESFAVDPNEILHKEKFIKSEPSTPTPTPADFRPVFHNIRVPTKEDLLFKMEPMDTFHIKQEDDSSNQKVEQPVTSTTTATTTLHHHHQLLMSPEEEGISVNDIKKEVLSELFDCETEYCNDEGGRADDASFLDAAYDDTVMHYSDDSQDDFTSCLLEGDFAGQEGRDGSAVSGHSPNHNLDISLKLEALSPMSSFDSEPVPQTPELYVNKEDVFKAHFDMDLSQLLEDDLSDFVEEDNRGTEEIFFRRFTCKEDNYGQLRSLVGGLRSKIY